MTRAAWATSTRRQRLPRNWSQLRAAVKRRAGGRCEAIVNGRRCKAPGNQCDHINRGDDHTLPNLQWLCQPCHDAKTRAENSVTERRPREQHPGLTGH